MKLNVGTLASKQHAGPIFKSGGRIRLVCRTRSPHRKWPRPRKISDSWWCELGLEDHGGESSDLFSSSLFPATPFHQPPTTFTNVNWTLRDGLVR